MSFRTQPAPPARPNRCQLFGPGSRPAIFEKMAASAADVINLDLEDSVPPAEKDAARVLVRNALVALDWGSSERMVRINQGAVGEEDLAAIAAINPVKRRTTLTLTPPLVDL